MGKLAIKIDSNSAYIISIPETASDPEIPMHDQIILMQHEKIKRLRKLLKRVRSFTHFNQKIMISDPLNKDIIKELEDEDNSK